MDFFKTFNHQPTMQPNCHVVTKKDLIKHRNYVVQGIQRHVSKFEKQVSSVDHQTVQMDVMHQILDQVESGKIKTGHMSSYCIGTVITKLTEDVVQQFLLEHKQPLNDEEQNRLFNYGCEYYDWKLFELKKRHRYWKDYFKDD